MAINCWDESVNVTARPRTWILPRSARIFCADTHGTKTPRNFPNATATAAMVPVWITRKSVQP